MMDSKTTMQRECNEIQADVMGYVRGTERVRSGAKFMIFGVALQGKYMLHLKGNVALQRKECCT